MSMHGIYVNGDGYIWSFETWCVSEFGKTQFIPSVKIAPESFKGVSQLIPVKLLAEDKSLITEKHIEEFILANRVSFDYE